MKALFGIALHQAVSTSTQSTEVAPQTEEELFHARGRELRRLRPGRLAGWFKALIPAPLAARIAAHRAERDLQSHIKRLEDLSGHLLDDIGVEKLGPSDFIVWTDDMHAVRAPLLAAAAPLAGRPKTTPREGLAFVAGSA